MLGLLIGVVLNLNANPTDKDKTVCDEKHVMNCIKTFVQQTKDIQDSEKISATLLYDTYKHAFKMDKILDKECNERKKFCKLSKATNSYLTKAQGAFLVDDLVSGYSSGNIFSKKFPKNKNGTYNILKDTISAKIATESGIPISGEHLLYHTTILNQKATIRLFLTKKNEKLYAVIVVWDSIPTLDGIDFHKKVKEALNKKYNKSQMKDVELPLLMSNSWTPNTRATITLSTVMVDPLSSMSSITYIDSKYQNENEVEKKQNLENTDRI